MPRRLIHRADWEVPLPGFSSPKTSGLLGGVRKDTANRFVRSSWPSTVTLTVEVIGRDIVKVTLRSK
eukprot:7052850-Prorocentrum_lima.AAC.1